MIHFCSEALLKEVCDSDGGHNLPTTLVEIAAAVLDQEVRAQPELLVAVVPLETCQSQK